MAHAATDMVFDDAVRPASRRRLAVIASLLLILGAAAAALFLAAGFDRQLDDVARTYEVRKLARELIMGLMEAESAQRGFVLTEDAEYLEPYADALTTVDQRMQSLLTVTAANSDQRTRISGMAEEMQLKRNEMQATIDLVTDGKLDDARALIRSNAGLRLMAGMGEVVETFVTREDELLVARNRTVRWSRQALVIAIVVGLMGAAVLAFVLFNRSQAEVSALSRSRRVLASANEELEAHVRVRTAEVEEARARAEHERQRVEALLRESNHRIGNSLATVSSLLALQMLRSPSEKVKAALESARGRVHAIAAGHRRLRLGNDLETTEAGEFLEAVVDDFRTTQPSAGKVAIHTDFASVVISARDATTIGILLGELITNALKHAFKDGREGQIWTQLTVENGAILSVSDNGIGIAEDHKPGDGGLGSEIVSQLARQFAGSATYNARDGGGTAVVVTLPKLGGRPVQVAGT